LWLSVKKVQVRADKQLRNLTGKPILFRPNTYLYHKSFTPMVTLFVGGFPLDMEEIELVKLFMPFGQVSTIKIIRDKRTRVCKGYAFIEMTDQAGAEEAIANLNGREMGDRSLAVKIREENEKPKPKPFFPKKPYSSGPPSYTKVDRGGRGGGYSSGGSDQFKKKRPRRPIG
jgi:RNA recognition motif-containing protein